MKTRPTILRDGHGEGNGLLAHARGLDQEQGQKAEEVRLPHVDDAAADGKSVDPAVLHHVGDVLAGPRAPRRRDVLSRRF
mgnify:CR=1 FL=1